MPGSVAFSSTQALTSLTLRYGLHIAEHGLEVAASQSIPLKKGINVYDGKCVHPKVADTFGFPHIDGDYFI